MKIKVKTNFESTDPKNQKTLTGRIKFGRFPHHFIIKLKLGKRLTNNYKIKFARNAKKEVSLPDLNENGANMLRKVCTEELNCLATNKSNLNDKRTLVFLKHFPASLLMDGDIISAYVDASNRIIAKKADNLIPSKSLNDKKLKKIDKKANKYENKIKGYYKNKLEALKNDKGHKYHCCNENFNINKSFSVNNYEKIESNPSTTDSYNNLTK